MGKAFKLNNNYKKVKKVEEDLKPLKSPYDKEKPNKEYKVFYNFMNQWVPDKYSYHVDIAEPSLIWDGPVSTNNFMNQWESDKYSYHDDIVEPSLIWDEPSIHK